MLAAVLFCAGATTALTACGDDEDDNVVTPSNPAQPSQPTTPTAQPTNVSATVSLKQTPDMLEYCDIKVEYTDSTGAKAVSITDSLYTMKFAAKLPTTITIRKTVAMKADKDLSASEDFYYVTNSFLYGYTLTDAKGATTFTEATKAWNDKLIKAKGHSLVKAIANGTLNQTITIDFDANGTPTVSSMLDSSKQYQ